MPEAPRIEGVYETVLYADDMAAARAFYRDLLGLRSVAQPDDWSAAFRLPDGGLLLLFTAARSSAAGRFVPAHGATGAGHVAFRLADGDYEGCAAHLRAAGVEVEREIGWPRGGRSFYVRDPAGNSIEFVEGEIWDD